MKNSSADRRAWAGATEPDPDTYEHANTHCDVLVVGAGPAGLAAALSRAARARVYCWPRSRLHAAACCRPTVTDRRQALGGLGGQLHRPNSQRFDNVTLDAERTCSGYYDHNVLAALERVNDHRR